LAQNIISIQIEENKPSIKEAKEKLKKIKKKDTKLNDGIRKQEAMGKGKLSIMEVEIYSDVDNNNFKKH